MMNSGLSFLIEASEVLPLSNSQRDALYSSVYDNIRDGDFAGHYVEEGVFLVEYARIHDDFQRGEDSHEYAAIFDTPSQKIDFDFRLILFPEGPGNQLLRPLREHGI